MGSNDALEGVPSWSQARLNLCRSLNYTIFAGARVCYANVCRATKDSFILRQVVVLVKRLIILLWTHEIPD